MKKVIRYNCEKSKDSIMRYLLVKSAPVIMGVKPAILLRLCKCQHVKRMKHFDSFCLHQNEIMEALNIECLVMKNNGRDIQVLFYDKAVMAAYLRQPAIAGFLDECGYSAPKSLPVTMNELKARFTGTDFPHEIGIFLGYPLKDVKGYMSRKAIAVKLEKAMWRVFGDPAESLFLMDQYRMAEKAGQLVASTGRSISESINQLKQISSLDKYIFE